MKTNRKTLLLTLGATFILMALLVTYTTSVMYRSSYSYVQELGNDKASAITADLENYLENASSVLWVAADTVDHMVANGATYEEIVEYITRESANTEAQFDESYTGTYGYINGLRRMTMILLQETGIRIPLLQAVSFLSSLLT